ncbi:glycosyltransferase family 4 protein [Blastococcus sp. SYSU DS0828]
MLERLSEMRDTDVLVVRRPSSTDEDVEALRAAVPRARVRTFAPWWETRTSAPWTAVRILVALLTRTPPWIVGRYSRELSKFIHKYHSDYSRIIGIGEATGIYVRRGSGWHWDKANVLTVSSRDAIVGSRGLPGLRPILDFLTSQPFEARVGVRVASVTVTSEDERRRWLKVSRSSDQGRVSVLPSSVPAAPVVKLGSDPTTIVWLGSFVYAPNVQGLLQFLAVADPVLTHAGVRLRVVGADCPPGLRAELRRYPCVDFLGFAPDLHPALNGATAAIVPVWQGAGIKMKTLTLLAHGLPVVSTTVGAEGIRREAFWHVSDDAEDLARACAEVTLGPPLLAKAAAGRQVWSDDHSPDAFNTALTAIFA